MSRIHGLWLGPLLGVAAFLSYFFVFSQWPVTRDVPWLNVLFLLITIGISVGGLKTAWAGGVLKKIAGVTSTFFSAFLLIVFLGYTYGLSYQVPDASQAAESGTALPDVTLVSNTGDEVNLKALASKKLILVFYRGHW